MIRDPGRVTKNGGEIGVIMGLPPGTLINCVTRGRQLPLGQRGRCAGSRNLVGMDAGTDDSSRRVRVDTRQGDAR